MTYPLCKGCERPLRHPRKKPQDHPGTIPARANGRCAPCAKHYIGEPDAATLAARIALAGYIANRRRRGIPEEGVLA